MDGRRDKLSVVPDARTVRRSALDPRGTLDYAYQKAAVDPGVCR